MLFKGWLPRNFCILSLALEGFDKCLLLACFRVVSVFSEALTVSSSLIRVPWGRLRVVTLRESVSFISSSSYLLNFRSWKEVKLTFSSFFSFWFMKHYMDALFSHLFSFFLWTLYALLCWQCPIKMPSLVLTSNFQRFSLPSSWMNNLHLKPLKYKILSFKALNIS